MGHKKERVEEILRHLRRMYPKAKCSLDYSTPFELLVATILSAQSTDVRVNLVTPPLFKTYPTVESLAAARLSQLEREIHSTGFFRNKAKALIAMSIEILERHAGEVPRTIEELVALPGVGRKTANVVLGNAFGIQAGVVVDTHVGRVAGRLGFTEEWNPERIEADLMPLVPQKEWTKFSHRMIVHGRTLCIARKPKCSECLLNEHCPSAQAPLE